MNFQMLNSKGEPVCIGHFIDLCDLLWQPLGDPEIAMF